MGACMIHHMSHGGLASPTEPMSWMALGRRSLTYAVGGLAYKGVALVALPILARILSPAELGILDLAAVLATLIGLIAVFGSDQAVAYLEPRADRTAGVWSSALFVLSAAAGVLLLAAAACGEAIATVLTGDAANGPIIFAAALYGWVVALAMTALNAIRLHGSPRTYALASFAVVTAEMAAALLVAWRFESPVTLMVLAWAAGALAVSLPLLVRHVPHFGPPRVTTIRRLVSFGAPLLPAAVAWLIGDAWIRGEVARGLELDALGNYGIASRIASVAVLAATGFAVAWQPYILGSPSPEVRPRTASALPALVLAVGALAVLLTLLAPEVVLLLAGDRYSGAVDVVAPLAGGAVALGIFSLLAATTAASGITRRVGIAALLGMAIQFMAVGPLVGAFALPGAGLASLAGYVTAVGVLLPDHRTLLRGRAGRSTAGAFAIAVVGLALAGVIQDSELWVRLVIVLAVVAVGAAALRIAGHGEQSR